MDNQVKLRGYRVELGEIENVLAQYPGVRDSVLSVREETLGNKRLVAYVVPRRGALRLCELRTYLAEKLPEYIPAVYVMLESIPSLPNGKFDRRALPSLGNNVPEANEVTSSRARRLKS